MKKNFPKLTIILIFLLVKANLIFSQNTTNNFTLKTSLGYVNKGAYNSSKAIQPSIEGNYRLGKFLDAGVYLGYATLAYPVRIPLSNTTDQFEWKSFNSYAFFYGITTNIHILPLFFDERLRFDLYMSPTVGYMIQNHSTYTDRIEQVWSTPELEYGVGLGLKFKINKNFGVFGEYSVGKYFIQEFGRAKIGVAVNL